MDRVDTSGGVAKMVSATGCYKIIAPLLSGEVSAGWNTAAHCNTVILFNRLKYR
jgi:hypothetical protein